MNDVMSGNHTSWDADLIQGSRRFDAALVEAYLRNLTAHPLHAQIAKWKKHSMLAIESLTLMRAFALEARGAILEIGAYVGGGTLALVDGAKASGHKTVFTVEVGGAYDHPTMPSKDILADWHKTLRVFGHEGYVSLHPGWGNSPEIAQAIKEKLGYQKIDLVVIDANGMPWDNLYYFRDVLTDDCLFVFDDYGNIDYSGENEKFALARTGVEQGVAQRAFIRYGVVQWGTWFGRRGPTFLDRIEAERLDEFRRAGWIS